MGAKPVVTTFTSGIVNPSQLNSNLDILATAISDALDRGGDSDTNNVMLGDLDMGGFAIKNATGVNSQGTGGLATIDYVDNAVTAALGGTIPTVTRNTFTTVSLQQTFALSEPPLDVPLVYINGIYQNQSTFDIVGSNLIFVDPVPSGYVVEVVLTIPLVISLDVQSAAESAVIAEEQAVIAAAEADAASASAIAAAASAVTASTKADEAEAAAALATATTASGGSVLATPDAVAVRDSNGDLAGDILGASAQVGVLIPKVVNIGDWNMDALDYVIVAHGLTYTKIRSVDVVIFKDSNDPLMYPLTITSSSGVAQGWVSLIDSVYISIDRLTGGLFDNANYNETSYNRGYITIWHVA